MKNIDFYKYQGTGNDFVLIDNRNLSFPKNAEIIHHLCDRHFGIGADGLILIENDPSLDFKMVYYNSDGNESSMCGNGGRCMVAFAKELGIITHQTRFNAIDGEHYAEIKDEMVKLKMIEVHTIEQNSDHYILNTGSPHYVAFISNLATLELVTEAKKIRYNSRFAQEGINVNFVEIMEKNLISVRTYERGVEDETLACGTGVTAATLAFAEQNTIPKGDICIQVLGGKLKVYWEKKNNTYTNIFLEGLAQKVFKGNLTL